MAFSRRVQIRWRDMDAFGHVNNAVYLTYAEEARDACLTALLDEATQERIVVRRVEVDFLSPLTQEDGAVEVEVSLVRVGESSVGTAERICAVSDGRRVAELAAVVVHIDEAHTARAPWPEAMRRRLLAECVPAHQ